MREGSSAHQHVCRAPITKRPGCLRHWGVRLADIKPFETGHNFAMTRHAIPDGDCHAKARLTRSAIYLNRRCRRSSFFSRSNLHWRVAIFRRRMLRYLVELVFWLTTGRREDLKKVPITLGPDFSVIRTKSKHATT